MWKDLVDLSVFCGHLYQPCRRAMQQLNSPFNSPFPSSYKRAAMNTTELTASSFMVPESL